MHFVEYLVFLKIRHYLEMTFDFATNDVGRHATL
jgi:hypothetical protein